jgi:hypothetical protein
MLFREGDYMRKIIGLFMAVVMTLTCLAFGATAVYAAEVIPVYLNGEKITFDSNDAQPQIFSSRTYVPIRKTAESLGLSIDWNSKTETLTFTREGYTIAHTMRSNIVYVNGDPVTFDTKSINRQNRTLMPVRMLAESIGADVEWDDSARCVYITTATPKVKTVSASQTVVPSGTEITLTATASDATSVRFVDSDTKAVVSEVSQYTEATDGTRTFSCKVTPSNDTSDSVIKTYYVYPGTGSSFIETLDSSGKVSVMVSSSVTTTETTTETTTSKSTSYEVGVQDNYESDHMVSLKVNKTSLEVDEYLQITVKTDSEVNRVKVTNSTNEKNAVASTYDKSGDDRVFTIKTKLTQKGKNTLSVYLSTEDGGYESDAQNIIVKVTDEDDDSDTEYDDMEIIDIDTPDDEIYKGEEVTVDIYTSKDITEVAIYNSDDKRMASTAFKNKTYSNKYRWRLTFDMDSDDTAKYTVYAYNADGDETKDTFKLEGDSYSKSDIVVVSVVQKTKDVEEGEDCKLIVRTTKSAEKVVIKTKGGKELATSTSGSSASSGIKEFKVTIEAQDSDTTYVAYAYDDDDDVDSRKFTLDVDEEETPEINSVELSDTTVDVDDDVDVTVYTNQAVEKLWIEDASGDRVSKKLTKPDDETSDEYIWELDFTAEKSGSRVSYVVIAQGDSSTDIDEYDFKIRVDK